MNKPLSIRQNLLPQLLKNSEAAWKRRDYQQAMDILEQATKQAPHESLLLLYLGRCHGSRYDYAAAEQCFEKAVRLEGWKADAYLKAGRYCLAFHGYEMASRFFERGLKRNENAMELLVELARIYMRQNRLNEAIELTDRALHLNGNFTPALLARATLHRQTGQLEEAEKILRSYISTLKPNGWIHAESWYELGTILDRQSRFDEAMKAFLEAKSAKLPVAAQTADWKATEAELNQMAKSISTDVLRRWSHLPEGCQPRRLALLCGHPRSGTTLLEQILDAHPEITSAEETQIFYEETFVPLTRGLSPEALNFSSILESASSERLRRARENYFRYAERFIGQNIGTWLLMDKNPSLTVFIPAFIRVFPETKFLIALRDPRDVCLSCFMQPFFPTSPLSSNYPSLEATIAQYTATMGFWQIIKPLMPNPWLEVRYEDLVDDLESTSRRVMELFGIIWDNRLLNFQQHAQNKLVRSPTYADVRKPVSNRAIGRWRNYQKYLEPHLEKLEPFGKAFGYE